MRAIWVLALTMTVALVGCGKKKPAPVSADNSGNGGVIPAGGVGVVVNPGEALGGGGGGGGTSTPPKHVSAVSGAGGAVAPNQNGNLSVTGGQGAIQSPRMAAARTVNDVQLNQLYTSMFQTWSLDNRVPSRDEVMKEAQQNPQLFPLLKDEVIILTGTNRGDGVWAYSQYPQRMGDHYVVTQSGRAQMSPEELRKRLEQQQSPVKLAK
jgi:hypothetical protein